jgi:hypothetical protein
MGCGGVYGPPPDLSFVGVAILNSLAFEQARTLPRTCQSASSETPATAHGLDVDACKARCLSPTDIVRSFAGNVQAWRSAWPPPTIYRNQQFLHLGNTVEIASRDRLVKLKWGQPDCDSLYASRRARLE